MVHILRATCTDGQLILQEKLDPELEGKKVRVIVQEIVEPESENSITTTEPSLESLYGICAEDSIILDESDTWTEQDRLDLVSFSLQSAGLNYPEDEGLIE
ncbi:hypothetical protein V0288_14750 [Pannus brasiliensis CCIBt3594]|uniref:Uncharacterized protein n=1 Tax=Pannus brasiliensis CCIBt3594 TaxID=1427578 RepID=A0AAW9QVG4_9CHRO